jgi:hypothetical protein
MMKIQLFFALLMTVSAVFAISDHSVTLVYLRQGQSSSQWIGEDGEKSLIDALSMAFKKQDIPYLFPLLDLNDMIEIQSLMKSRDDLSFGSFKEAIIRYQPKAILVATIKKEGQGLENDWILLQAHGKISRQNKAPEFAMLFDEMMEHLRLAFHEVATSTNNVVEQNTVTLQIVDVTNAEKFTQIQALLRKMPMVLSVKVIELKPESTVFSLVINTHPDLLKQSIEQSGLEGVKIL